jgi:Family of unknown function (DUF6763)
MNTGVGPARIGQWYTRSDKGESFQVVGCEPEARTIETQTFDGDIDEIDFETWVGLPLAFAEPPEDWTGPVDDVERDDLGYSETEMSGTDWAQPLQPLRTEGEERGEGEEAWEETAAEDERDPEGEGTPEEPLASDIPSVAELLR